MTNGDPTLEWLGTMEAGPPGERPWLGAGRVAFEWLEGRAFLIQRWTVDVPEAPDGIALIGSGADPDRYGHHYFNSRGRSPRVRDDARGRHLDALA